MIGLTREEFHGVWNEIVHELRLLDSVFNRFDERGETSQINQEPRQPRYV
jgi:hypothetical protein